MATDYTVLFTVIGKHVKKLRDYYALIATLNTDRDAIVTVEVAQSATYLSDGLVAVYETMKGNVVSWVQALIARVSIVVTDPTIVLNNFPFGSIVDVQTAWAALIKEMTATDKNVVASSMTTSAVTLTATNSYTGTLILGTKLDGYNPPMSGATPNVAYSGLTSQMYPDDETITATCVQDSENGAARGAERFSVAGTGAASDPYSTTGENLGVSNGINVADSGASGFVTNSGLDTWSGSPADLDSWEPINGIAGTDYRRGTGGSSGTLIANTGYAFETMQSNDPVNMIQTLNASAFQRNRAYFISVWAKRVLNSLATPAATVKVSMNNTDLITLTIAPTGSTHWTQYSGQFIVPAEVDISVHPPTISINAGNENTKDGVLIDQIVITPCTYVAGIAVAIFGGTDKFLNGDKMSFRLQNDSAGKFQSFARKAYKIQLPTDGTPTISDGLVA